jgi:hypothetical protein
MTKPTPEDRHSAEMRSALLHRRSNRRQEKAMLLKAQDRVAEIDAELALIEADLTRYGHEEPT